MNKISFISKDAADNRSFSYVVGGDGDGKHVLFGVKTDKPVGRSMTFPVITIVSQHSLIFHRGLSSTSFRLSSHVFSLY